MILIDNGKNVDNYNAGSKYRNYISIEISILIFHFQNKVGKDWDVVWNLWIK